MRKRRIARILTGGALLAGAVIVSAGGASPASAASSSAAQIMNIRTVPEDLDVGGMITFNSKVYFIGDDDKYGDELWVTDGTEAGTKLLKDIATGSKNGRPNDSSPQDLTVIGSTLYFTADDHTNGRELWSTDGTTAGTKLVKDINPGENGSTPGGLRNLDGTLFFRANDGTSGVEPWKSDGTSAGTTLIADIYPGSNDSILDDTVAVVGATAYIPARDEAYDFELWAITTSGASIVSDMTAGSDGSYPNDLTAVGDSVYFNVNGSTYGWRSIYRYDGTNLVRIKGDYYRGKNFTAIDSDTIVYSAMDGYSGEELWVTDGTADSGVLLKNICQGDSREGSVPENFVLMGTKVYFTANDCTNGPALWETDGTEAGTKMVKDIAPEGEDANWRNPKVQYLTAVGSTLYFRANDSGASSWADAPVTANTPERKAAVSSAAPVTTHGDELWKSDGTTAGTVMVKDINTEVEDYGDYSIPGGSDIQLGSQGPQQFPLLDGNIVFRACDGSTCGLWESDGTSAGTTLIANPNPVDRGSSPEFRGFADDKAFFMAGGDDGKGGLYVTDGTSAGTTKLRTGYFDYSVMLNSKLIFAAYDETVGGELMISDGTVVGTKMLKDIRPGSDGSNPYSFAAAGKYAYFIASDGTNGRELWRTDGTEAGTIMLTDIPGDSYGSPIGADPQSLTAVGSQLYFSGYQVTTGRELWKSDGTKAGTVMVKDINAGEGYDGPGSADSSPFGFTKVGTTVFFSAISDTTGRELWKTDGTAAGTVLVKDIRTGEQYGQPASGIDPSNRESFVALSGNLYFSANDGTNGQQLWTSDGTTAGTVKVKQVSTYQYNGGPNPIVVMNNKMYFQASTDDGSKNQLWSSDGTAAGTALLKDIEPSQYDFVPAGNKLYMIASDGEDEEGDQQVWETDGTAAGTKQLTIGLKDVASLLPFRGGVLFRANNGMNGREFWGVGLPVGTPQTISFTPPTDLKANETLALTATATSGLTVTFTAVGDCLIKTTGKNAGKLKLEGSGYCEVTASQAGNDTYARADDVRVGILISKNSVVVTFIGTVPAKKGRISALASYSGSVQLKAQVTPALEGCRVQFEMSPDTGTPAGPYVGTSDEDGVVLSPPLVIGDGTYDFKITPLGDCEGSVADTPGVYLGPLPETGANPMALVWAALALLGVGGVLASRKRRLV